MGMSMKSRKELTAKVAKRYRSNDKRTKGRILDEFCASTEYNRAYAAMLLRGYGKTRVVATHGGSVKLVPTKKRKSGSGRPPVYTKQTRVAVIKVWKRLGYLCGKRLAPMIRSSIDAIRVDPFLKVSEHTCTALQHISASTIDRLLKPERAKMQLRGRGYTHSTGGLWDLIPVRTFGEWAGVPPGHFQADTVGHEGGMGGTDCAFSLCVTDICLGWTERRGLQNRAARWVEAALEEIRHDVPFEIVHLHPDNGSEFINHNLKNYCDRHGIELSRSRPEKKNDNCYVEQKNFDTIRKLVGYARYSTPEALAALNELYRVHGLLLNYFLPSQKLINKTRVGSRVKKTYDAFQAPADRLLAHPEIPKDVKERVRQTQALHNPLSLADETARLQRTLLALADRPMTRTGEYA